MSLNIHNLQRLLEDSIKSTLVERVGQYMAAGNEEQPQRWATQFGVTDLDELGNGQWLNLQVLTEPTHLSLHFATSNSGNLPMRALDALFVHGLKAAVLHVFYDKVGETERMHFGDSLWVSRQPFLAKRRCGRALQPGDLGMPARWRKCGLADGEEWALINRHWAYPGPGAGPQGDRRPLVCGAVGARRVWRLRAEKRG